MLKAGLVGKGSCLVGLVMTCLLALMACGGGGGGGTEGCCAEDIDNSRGIGGTWAGIMSPGFYIEFTVEETDGKTYITSANGDYAAIGCTNYMYTWHSDDLNNEIVDNACHIFFPDELNVGDGRGMELHIYFDSASEMHGTWVGETFCEPLIEGTFRANRCTDYDQDGELFCSFPADTIPEKDCDDGNADVYRDAVEICDGLDNDCNGAIDDVSFMEGEAYEDQILLYPDRDGDGYGDASFAGKILCSDLVDGIQYLEDNSDCDDDDLSVNPDFEEICRNGVDDNCSGAENENCLPIEIAVPEDFETIQEAVDIAAAGDTIQVADGTYTENINFKGKPITLKSVNGPATTIIDGTTDRIRSGTVVTFNACEDENSKLDGFTITDGLRGISIGGTDTCDHSPVIENCIVFDNGTNTFSAGMQTKGGGFFISPDSSAVIRNCIIAKNNAHLGGGLYIGGSARLIHNTIVDNFASYNGGPAESLGGGIYYAGLPDASLSVVNSILWGNRKGPCPYDFGTHQSVCGKSQVYLAEEGGAEIAHCDVEDGVAGSGNLDADPLLDDDNHLQMASPCIDAGADDLSLYPNLPSTDIDGDGRPHEAGFDVGADEYRLN